MTNLTDVMEGETTSLCKYFDWDDNSEQAYEVTKAMHKSALAVVADLDWRNRTDKVPFNDGSDIVVWYDQKIAEIRNQLSEQTAIEAIS